MRKTKISHLMCVLFFFFLVVVSHAQAASPSTGTFFLTPEKYPPTNHVTVLSLSPMKQYIVIAEIDAITEEDDTFFRVSGGDPIKALVEKAKTIGADAIILIDDSSITRNKKEIRHVKAEAIRYKDREDIDKEQ